MEIAYCPYRTNMYGAYYGMQTTYLKSPMVYGQSESSDDEEDELEVSTRGIFQTWCFDGDLLIRFLANIEHNQAKGEGQPSINDPTDQSPPSSIQILEPLQLAADSEQETGFGFPDIGTDQRQATNDCILGPEHITPSRTISTRHKSSSSKHLGGKAKTPKKSPEAVGSTTASPHESDAPEKSSRPKGTTKKASKESKRKSKVEESEIVKTMESKPDDATRSQNTNKGTKSKGKGKGKGNKKQNGNAKGVRFDMTETSVAKSESQEATPSSAEAISTMPADDEQSSATETPSKNEEATNSLTPDSNLEASAGPNPPADVEDSANGESVLTEAAAEVSEEVAAIAPDDSLDEVAANTSKEQNPMAAIVAADGESAPDAPIILVNEQDIQEHLDTPKESQIQADPVVQDGSPDTVETVSEDEDIANGESAEPNKQNEIIEEGSCPASAGDTPQPSPEDPTSIESPIISDDKTNESPETSVQEAADQEPAIFEDSTPNDEESADARTQTQTAASEQHDIREDDKTEPAETAPEAPEERVDAPQPAEPEDGLQEGVDVEETSPFEQESIEAETQQSSESDLAETLTTDGPTEELIDDVNLTETEASLQDDEQKLDTPPHGSEETCGPEEEKTIVMAEDTGQEQQLEEAASIEHADTCNDEETAPKVEETNDPGCNEPLDTELEEINLDDSISVSTQDSIANSEPLEDAMAAGNEGAIDEATAQMNDAQVIDNAAAAAAASLGSTSPPDLPTPGEQEQSACIEEASTTLPVSANASEAVEDDKASTDSKEANEAAADSTSGVEDIDGALNTPTKDDSDTLEQDDALTKGEDIPSTTASVIANETAGVIEATTETEIGEAADDIDTEDKLETVEPSSLLVSDKKLAESDIGLEAALNADECAESSSENNSPKYILLDHDEPGNEADDVDGGESTEQPPASSATARGDAIGGEIQESHCNDNANSAEDDSDSPLTVSDTEQAEVPNLQPELSAAVQPGSDNPEDTGESMVPDVPDDADEETGEKPKPNSQNMSEGEEEVEVSDEARAKSTEDINNEVVLPEDEQISDEPNTACPSPSEDIHETTPAVEEEKILDHEDDQTPELKAETNLEAAIAEVTEEVAEACSEACSGSEPSEPTNEDAPISECGQENMPQDVDDNGDVNVEEETAQKDDSDPKGCVKESNDDAAMLGEAQVENILPSQDNLEEPTEVEGEQEIQQVETSEDLEPPEQQVPMAQVTPGETTEPQETPDTQEHASSQDPEFPAEAESCNNTMPIEEPESQKSDLTETFPQDSGPQEILLEAMVDETSIDTEGTFGDQDNDVLDTPAADAESQQTLVPMTEDSAPVDEDLVVPGKSTSEDALVEDTSAIETPNEEDMFPADVEEPRGNTDQDVISESQAADEVSKTEAPADLEEEHKSEADCEASNGACQDPVGHNDLARDQNPLADEAAIGEHPISLEANGTPGSPENSSPPGTEARPRKHRRHSTRSSHHRRDSTASHAPSPEITRRDSGISTSSKHKKHRTPEQQAAHEKRKAERTPEEQARHDRHKAVHRLAKIAAKEGRSSADGAVIDDSPGDDTAVPSALPRRMSSSRRYSHARSDSNSGERSKFLNLHKGESVVKSPFFVDNEPHVKERRTSSTHGLPKLDAQQPKLDKDNRKYSSSKAKSVDDKSEEPTKLKREPKNIAVGEPSKQKHRTEEAKSVRRVRRDLERTEDAIANVSEEERRLKEKDDEDRRRRREERKKRKEAAAVAANVGETPSREHRRRRVSEAVPEKVQVKRSPITFLRSIFK